MPDLDSVLSNKCWVDANVFGSIIRVAYRPAATSLMRQAEIQRDMQAMQKSDNPDAIAIALWTAQVFCEVVCEWDLTRQGVPIPLTPEGVAGLSEDIINAIMEAVQAHKKKTADEKKLSNATSVAGLPTTVKSVPVQNGTHSSEPRGTWA